ncbi:MAG: hypothetical protein RL065_2093, partial [Bacteroidota bacterium]
MKSKFKFIFVIINLWILTVKGQSIDLFITPSSAGSSTICTQKVFDIKVNSTYSNSIPFSGNYNFSCGSVSNIGSISFPATQPAGTTLTVVGGNLNIVCTSVPANSTNVSIGQFYLDLDCQFLNSGVPLSFIDPISNLAIPASITGNYTNTGVSNVVISTPLNFNVDYPKLTEISLKSISFLPGHTYYRRFAYQNTGTTAFTGNFTFEDLIGGLDAANLEIDFSKCSLNIYVINGLNSTTTIEADYLNAYSGFPNQTLTATQTNNPLGIKFSTSSFPCNGTNTLNVGGYIIIEEKIETEISSTLPLPTNTICIGNGKIYSNYKFEWGCSTICNCTGTPNCLTKLTGVKQLNPDKYKPDLSIVRLLPYKTNTVQTIYSNQPTQDIFWDKSDVYKIGSPNSNEVEWLFVITNNSLKNLYNSTISLNNSSFPTIKDASVALKDKRNSYTYIDVNSIKINDNTVLKYEDGSTATPTSTFPSVIPLISSSASPNLSSGYSFNFVQNQISSNTNLKCSYALLENSDFFNGTNTNIPSFITSFPCSYIKKLTIDVKILKPNECIYISFKTKRMCAENDEFLFGVPNTNKVKFSNGIDFNDWYFSREKGCNDECGNQINLNDFDKSSPQNPNLYTMPILTTPTPNTLNPVYDLLQNHFSYSSNWIAHENISVDGAYSRYGNGGLYLNQIFINNATSFQPFNGWSTGGSTYNDIDKQEFEILNTQWGCNKNPNASDVWKGYEFFTNNPILGANIYIPNETDNNGAVAPIDYGALVVEWTMDDGIFIDNSIANAYPRAKSGINVNNTSDLPTLLNSTTTTLITPSPSDVTFNYSFNLPTSPPPQTFTTSVGTNVVAKFSFLDILNDIKTNKSKTDIKDVTGKEIQEYIQNSSFKFRLTATCGGSSSPYCRVRTYFQLPCYSCNAINQSCLIPLSEKGFTSTILCPGCFIPGINVGNATLERAIENPNSFGYVDDDNDGLADDIGGIPKTLINVSGTSGVPNTFNTTNVIDINQSITGDVLKCTIPSTFWSGSTDASTGAFSYSDIYTHFCFNSGTKISGLNNFFNYLYHEIIIPHSNSSEMDLEFTDKNGSSTPNIELWVKSSTTSAPFNSTLNDIATNYGNGILTTASNFISTKTIGTETYYGFNITDINAYSRNNTDGKYSIKFDVNDAAYQGTVTSPNKPWGLLPGQDYILVCYFKVNGNPNVPEDEEVEQTTFLHSDVNYRVYLTNNITPHFAFGQPSYNMAVAGYQSWLGTTPSGSSSSNQVTYNNNTIPGNTSTNNLLDALYPGSTINPNAGGYLYYCQANTSSHNFVVTLNRLHTTWNNSEGSACVKSNESHIITSLGMLKNTNRYFKNEFRIPHLIPSSHIVELDNNYSLNASSSPNTLTYYTPYINHTPIGAVYIMDNELSGNKFRQWLWSPNTTTITLAGSKPGISTNLSSLYPVLESTTISSYDYSKFYPLEDATNSNNINQNITISPNNSLFVGDGNMDLLLKYYFQPNPSAIDFLNPGSLTSRSYVKITNPFSGTQTSINSTANPEQEITSPYSGTINSNLTYSCLYNPSQPYSIRAVNNSIPFYLDCSNLTSGLNPNFEKYDLNGFMFINTNALTGIDYSSATLTINNPVFGLKIYTGTQVNYAGNNGILFNVIYPSTYGSSGLTQCSFNFALSSCLPSFNSTLNLPFIIGTRGCDPINNVPSSSFFILKSIGYGDLVYQDLAVRLHEAKLQMQTLSQPTNFNVCDLIDFQSKLKVVTTNQFSPGTVHDLKFKMNIDNNLSISNLIINTPTGVYTMTPSYTSGVLTNFTVAGGTSFTWVANLTPIVTAIGGGTLVEFNFDNGLWGTDNLLDANENFSFQLTCQTNCKYTGTSPNIEISSITYCGDNSNIALSNYSNLNFVGTGLLCLCPDYKLNVIVNPPPCSNGMGGNIVCDLPTISPITNGNYYIVNTSNSNLQIVPGSSQNFSINNLYPGTYTIYYNDGVNANS